MVLFDIATAFVVGGAIGLRAEGKRRDLALTATGLGVAAPGLIFLDAFPDWDWQYLVDPTALPPGVPGLFLIAVIVATLVGHRTCSASPKVLWTALGLLTVYTGFSVPRIPYVGTQAQYFAGEAPFLPNDFLILFACVVPLAVTVLAVCLHRATPVEETESTL